MHIHVGKEYNTILLQPVANPTKIRLSKVLFPSKASKPETVCIMMLSICCNRFKQDWKKTNLLPCQPLMAKG
jgi:hypothetical protein